MYVSVLVSEEEIGVSIYCSNIILGRPFELMCDASDYTIRAVLCQKRERIFQVIYYANQTLNDAQLNYATTEK